MCQYGVISGARDYERERLSGCSKIRNDVLAKVLNYMRYIAEWGSGLRRMNRILAEYGIRPDATDQAAFATRMNIYRASAKACVDEDNEDSCEDNEDNRGWNEDNCAGRGDRTNVDDLIFAKLRSNGRISVRQLASELPISKATVERALHKLQVSGCIRRRGGTRGVWEII